MKKSQYTLPAYISELSNLKVKLYMWSTSCP